MIELGIKQTLYIDHITSFGVYLCEEEDLFKRADCILLPKKQVPAGLDKGDPVEVFVYRDSDDRLIATTRIPILTVGETAVLEVAEVNKIGAFLKWGLEKDLLLPYSEQTVKVKKGEKYLAGLYIDKSQRLCATMKVYDMLSNDTPYKAEDHVEGIVYGRNPKYGVFVAVDQRYNAMIPEKEVTRRLRIGDVIKARVLEVRNDGKMNLSLREKGYLQMDLDSEKIISKLNEYNGFLPYHDKSSPEEIREEFGMSKNEFKRAIGRLYKNRKIVISSDGIRQI